MAADNTFDGLANDGSAAASRSAEPVSALQTEVMSAVRGAISHVMAGQGKGIDLAGIDLDFSSARVVQPPLLLATREQALAAPHRKSAPSAFTASRFAAVVAAILAIGGAAAAAWLQVGSGQGVPVLAQRPSAAVAASVEIVPMVSAGRPIVAVASKIEPKAEPALVATPVVATIRTQISPPAQPEPDIARRASKLLENGQVRETRALLLGAPAAARSDIALILARSFDGNYLQTLNRSDVQADSAEARRWYQRWFELASKEGSVPTTVRLDRLLQSLP